MLQLTAIKKSYRTGSFVQNALDGVSVAFRNNEFAAVLGPSGSGKTTMLNIIGGLDRYDEGDLKIDDVSTKQYKDRDWDIYRNNRIGFVFQSYNLIPHQSVLANVELALTLSGISRKERRERAIQALDEVGLIDHINKKPSQMSGGQMQRVAIARALINDPEILLADEPTGALDSETSKQVMELLTKIAKDRLVVMVTHNNALAERYANRLIRLTDGKITSDSHPFDPETEKEVNTREIRKTSMSFWTAVSLSFSNLMTKKTRTFITALAGSIGIVGIAAIFALANGINIYIKNVEEETLSMYPLTIQSSGFDFTSIFANHTSEGPHDGSETDRDFIREWRILDKVFSNRKRNDLATLKSHFDKNKATVDQYAITVQYTYDVTPQIFLKDTEKSIEQVNPDAIFSKMMMGQSSGMGFNMINRMQMFLELPNESKLYDNQYLVVAGHWPKKYDELVLVVYENNSISDFLLYSIGIKSRDDLRAMLEAVMNNTEADLVQEERGDRYEYSDFMGMEFKMILAADKYQYDPKYKVWVDKTKDEKYMRNLLDNQAMTLKIVGIVKPDPEATIYSLDAGIYYSPELIAYLMKQGAQQQIVLDQLAEPTKNVISGNTFLYDKDNPRNKFDFSKIIKIDKNAISKGFQMDQSAFTNINLDFSSIPLPAFDVNQLLAAMAGQLNIPSSQLSAIMTQTMGEFMTEELAKGVTDPNAMIADLPAYLARSDVQAKLSARLSAVISPSLIQEQLSKALSQYMQTMIQAYMGQMMAQLSEQIQLSIQQAFASMPAQMARAFSRAFKINMNEEEIMELMTAMMSPDDSSYEKNLSAFGYANVQEPIQINIYPKDFESKKEIIAFLDQYNDSMVSKGTPEKVIRYVDIVGTLMSSVTSIVDLVSYALVAFVSISLVVSSIMIGVITYISVLERKKEIGILRAVGASKKDIRRVFNAETMIVGLVAGILGILVTLVISLVANIILYNKFEIKNLSQLPLDVALILIAVSVLLSYIAGLIPASAATRKDPVEALRTE